MRIVFMGTPEFALPALAALVESRHDLVGIFTAPDRPVGRGQRPAPPPVKRFALERCLPLYQPPRLRHPSQVELLRSLLPDVVIVAAYGQILPRDVLAAPRLGCLNLHPSLLPRHRGASPVVGAILAGDAETGITLMQMDEGMDTGPIVAQQRVPLEGNETAGRLTDQLARLGAELLIETLPAWSAGALQPVPQDDSRSTYTRPLSKEDGVLDWALPAADLERSVRAYDPWPGCHTLWRGQRLRVLAAAVRSGSLEADPGTVAADPDSGDPVVQTGLDLLVLCRLQSEGRKAVSGADFLHGHRDLSGSRLR